ncbi:MAG TPA: ABC transporter permease [Bryobacteraceae bacterium]|nr:ABC transporter permease [Bryobacteraceae bacterium]
MSWFSRLKNAVNPRGLDADLEEEIRDHIERRAADLRRNGLDETEARRQAARSFGNATRTRESCRELRLAAALESSLQDARYALRGLLRNPAFAITTIASLGLAIGANTAIYSIVDAALLRTLPLPQPDRLVALSTSAGGAEGIPASEDKEAFSYPAYENLRIAAGDSARLALFDSPNRVEMKGSDETAYEEVTDQFVSPGAFEALAVSPALGRFFSPAEDHYPAPRAVAVLSYDYWQRRFGGDPAIMGRTLTIDGRPFSVLGVAARGFSGTEPGRFVDVWLPVTMADPGIFATDARLFRIMGRLAPGESREQLAARLQPAFSRYQELRSGGSELPAAVRKQMRQINIVADSGANGSGGFRRTFSRPLWILLGVSGCMLLIACANVASLLLARSSARASEMALRVSLGARRARLVRQLLTESLLLSSIAGLAGWLLARVAAPALVAMVSTPNNPVQLTLAPDGRALLFCAGICAISALFFGLLPALQATSATPIVELRHNNGPAGRLRTGRLFVGVQVAFAFCLVAAGVGFLFSLYNLAAVDTGFDPRGVAVVSMVNTAQRERQLPLLREIQTRVGHLPQVQGAATAWMAVFSGARRAQRVALPGKGLSQQEETFYRVSPGYFATLRTPLFSGRDFIPQDNDNEPVPTIVNRAFATKYFGGGPVIGREFRRDDGVRHKIVGVAANSHFGSLRNGPEPIAYMPMKPPRAFTLYVRSTLDAVSVSKMVQREAEVLGGGMRTRDVTTLDALVGSTIRTERLLGAIGGAFAFAGLILAATGIFGLLNYSVTRRTREIGIRAALGAQRPSLYGLVVKDLLGMMTGGLLAGIAGSIALMRFTQSFLFGIGSADPVVIGTAIAVFLGAALVAGGLPAHRAAALDPMTALRRD